MQIDDDAAYNCSDIRLYKQRYYSDLLLMYYLHYMIQTITTQKFPAAIMHTT